jgi:hypothetical protein
MASAMPPSHKPDAGPAGTNALSQSIKPDCHPETVESRAQASDSQRRISVLSAKTRAIEHQKGRAIMKRRRNGGHATARLGNQWVMITVQHSTIPESGIEASDRQLCS